MIQQQEFITPYSPEHNGMLDRVIRTLKDQCVHHRRLETLQPPSRVITDWIGWYNLRRVSPGAENEDPR